MRSCDLGRREAHSPTRISVGHPYLRMWATKNNSLFLKASIDLETACSSVPVIYSLEDFVAAADFRGPGQGTMSHYQPESESGELCESGWFKVNVAAFKRDISRHRHRLASAKANFVTGIQYDGLEQKGCWAREWRWIVKTNFSVFSKGKYQRSETFVNLKFDRSLMTTER